MVTESLRVLFGVLLAGVLCACGGGISRTHFIQGVDHYDEGRPRQAIEEWELAAQDDPDDLRVFYNLGLAYHDLFRQTDDADRRTRYQMRAEAAYRRALELDPGNPRATVALAMLLREVGRAEEADGLLDTYEPNGAEGETLPLWTRAAMHLAAARELEDGETRRSALEAAETGFRRVLEIDPEHLAARTALVETMRLLGRSPSEIDEVLSAGLAIHPYDFTLRLQHAMLQLEVAEGLNPKTEEGADAWSTAEIRYERARALSPNSVAVLWGLARIAEVNGEVETAVEMLWRARRSASTEELAALGLHDESARSRWREDLRARLLRLYQRLPEAERPAPSSRP